MINFCALIALLHKRKLPDSSLLQFLKHHQVKTSFAKALLSIPGSLSTQSACCHIQRDFSNCRIWKLPTYQNQYLLMLSVWWCIQNKMAAGCHQNPPVFWYLWKGSRESGPWLFLPERHTLFGCVWLYPEIFPLKSLFFSNEIKFAFPCLSQLKASSRLLLLSIPHSANTWRRHQRAICGSPTSTISMQEPSSLELFASKVLSSLWMWLLSLGSWLGKIIMIFL